MNSTNAATAAVIMYMVRLPIRISKPQIMIKTTVPGVRCPMRASLIEAMMIETIEQKRKKLSICTHFKLNSEYKGKVGSVFPCYRKAI